MNWISMLKMNHYQLWIISATTNYDMNQTVVKVNCYTASFNHGSCKSATFCKSLVNSTKGSPAIQREWGEKNPGPHSKHTHIYTHTQQDRRCPSIRACTSKWKWQTAVHGLFQDAAAGGKHPLLLAEKTKPSTTLNRTEDREKPALGG